MTTESPDIIERLLDAADDLDRLDPNEIATLLRSSALTIGELRDRYDRTFGEEMMRLRA